jgi:hypothetical protein
MGMHRDNSMLPTDALNKGYDLIFFSSEHGSGARIVDLYGRSCAEFINEPTYGEIKETWERIIADPPDLCAPPNGWRLMR